MVSSIKINLKSLIYIQIIYNCFIKFFVVDIGIPSFFNYVTDIITAFLLLMLVKSQNYKIKKVKPLIYAVVLLLLNIVSFVLDFSSPILFIWGFRNIYRFYIFFYTCYFILDYEDVFKIFEILEKILIINFFVCAFEYFIRHIDYDFLGGLFGNGVEGGNAPLNILMILVSGYVVLMYLYKKKSLNEVIFISVSCFAIAIVAEMKMFFFEYIVLFICVMLFIKKDLKIVIFSLSVIIIGVIAASAYGKMYSNNLNFLSIDFIKDYAFERTYGGATDINRLSAISIINERIYDSNLKYRLIGMGLGNAETGAYSFITSSFYNMYGERIKYNWFSHAFMYVESGYIGLLLYVMFFIRILRDSIKRRQEGIIYQLSIIVSAICLMMIIYNNTLRVESMGYTLFALLTIPYLKKGDSNGKKRAGNSNNELRN